MSNKSTLSNRNKLVDRAIGARIKKARELAGLSQEALGKGLGITFQQIQKYETGKNRVAASTLMLIAAQLGRPIAALLPDVSMSIDEDVAVAKRELAAGFAAVDEGLTAFDQGVRILRAARQHLFMADARAAGAPDIPALVAAE
jgi:transcriptional regulator with XRE-family HTH domain